MNFNKDTIAQLSKLSDEELTAELTRQLKIKQENGSLNEVEKMIRMISPFLSNDQKARLTKIIKSIQEN